MFGTLRASGFLVRNHAAGFYRGWYFGRAFLSKKCIKSRLIKLKLTSSLLGPLLRLPLIMATNSSGALLLLRSVASHQPLLAVPFHKA